MIRIGKTSSLVLDDLKLRVPIVCAECNVEDLHRRRPSERLSQRVNACRKWLKCLTGLGAGPLQSSCEATLFGPDVDGNLVLETFQSPG
jgi:hypothetical protein